MQRREAKPTTTARLALPLITGEDADLYEALRSRVSADVAPKDVLEEILLHDTIDLTWEISRLRRMKAGLFNATAYNSLRVVLKPLIDRDFREQDSENEQENEEERLERYLEENWARRIPAAVKRVDQLLQQADLTMDAVNAETAVPEHRGDGADRAHARGVRSSPQRHFVRNRSPSGIARPAIASNPRAD